MTSEFDTKIDQLSGPILVLGASGFVVSHIFKRILSRRPDVFGTIQTSLAWRLNDNSVDQNQVLTCDLLAAGAARELIAKIGPKTVFDCLAYGAYSFEEGAEQIYRTNFNLIAEFFEALRSTGVDAVVHAGSSSEYGLNCTAPTENSELMPNSEYAVSKVATSALISFFGKQIEMPVVNLRLYSVYGPAEDSSRLVPNLVRHISEGTLTPFVDPNISRDFVYIDDVVEAFIQAAAVMTKSWYGEAFNIGTGRATTIGELAEICKKEFAIEAIPDFTMPARKWYTPSWYANPTKATTILGWQAKTDLRAGLRATLVWYEGLEDTKKYLNSTKRNIIDRKMSISAVVACYKDGLAIPHMYKRLTQVFQDLRVDYEIIFVNDGSPDDSESTIQRISAKDKRVVGISHARNFGSQAAFRSGMTMSTKNSVVLLDGDLQDPPEIITKFVEKWREGYNVVYGRRVSREAPLWMQIAYKVFYRIFRYFSYVDVPKDAGDFSLIDREVVQWLLHFPERDLFLRGLRAYVGFKQIGVDYKRPERMFGRSTNNLFKNIGWAKKAILSFSKAPLDFLTSISVVIFLGAILLGVGQLALRLLAPELTPKGLTTIILVVVAFGSLNLLGLSILGEYIGKIFDESKGRPHYIRKSIIKDGELRKVSSVGHTRVSL